MRKKREKQGKTKILDFLSTIFYTALTIGIFAVLILGTFYRFGPLISSILFGLVLLVLLFLYLDMKKNERQEKEYQKTNISKIPLQDPVFGEMIFEKDTAKNTLTCQEINASFGNFHPVLQIIGYEDNCTEFFFRSLEFLYSRQTEIMENLLAISLDETCKTREDLLKTIEVTRICIQKYEKYLLGEDPLEGESDDWIITVEGKPVADRDSYHRIPTAYLNCRTREIGYVTVE